MTVIETLYIFTLYNGIKYFFLQPRSDEMLQNIQHKNILENIYFSLLAENV